MFINLILLVLMIVVTGGTPIKPRLWVLQGTFTMEISLLLLQDLQPTEALSRQQRRVLSTEEKATGLVISQRMRAAPMSFGRHPSLMQLTLWAI